MKFTPLDNTPIGTTQQAGFAMRPTDTVDPNTGYNLQGNLEVHDTPVFSQADIKRGKELRDAQEASPITLRSAAKMLNLSVAQVSSLWRGHSRLPDEQHRYALHMLKPQEAP